jgi:hypothetical protein
MIPLSIRFNHAPRQEKLQKNFRESGKDVADVSHTVNTVFSIAERTQRGAAAIQQFELA